MGLEPFAGLHVIQAFAHVVLEHAADQLILAEVERAMDGGELAAEVPVGR